MQIRNITPNQTGSMPQALHERHEDRQRDQHHAHLVDEHAEENQDAPSSPATTAIGAQAEAERSARPAPLLAPENDRICEKVVAPRMMNRMMVEIATVPRSAAKRFLHGQRAVDERHQHGGEGADRRRLGRRRPAGRHRDHDDDEDRAPAAPRTARRAAAGSSRGTRVSGAARRERRRDLHAQHDVGDERDRSGSGPAPRRRSAASRSRCRRSCRAAPCSAEGGISMSTAPIAITGPVAMVGW